MVYIIILPIIGSAWRRGVYTEMAAKKQERLVFSQFGFKIVRKDIDDLLSGISTYPVVASIVLLALAFFLSIFVVVVLAVYKGPFSSLHLMLVLVIPTSAVSLFSVTALLVQHCSANFLQCFCLTSLIFTVLIAVSINNGVSKEDVEEGTPNVSTCVYGK